MCHDSRHAACARAPVKVKGVITMSKGRQNPIGASAARVASILVVLGSLALAPSSTRSNVATSALSATSGSSRISVVSADTGTASSTQQSPKSAQALLNRVVCDNYSDPTTIYQCEVSDISGRTASTQGRKEGDPPVGPPLDDQINWVYDLLGDTYDYYLSMFTDGGGNPYDLTNRIGFRDSNNPSITAGSHQPAGLWAAPSRSALVLPTSPMSLRTKFNMV